MPGTVLCLLYINLFKINNSAQEDYPRFADNFPNATQSQDSNLGETNFRALNKTDFALEKTKV